MGEKRYEFFKEGAAAICNSTNIHHSMQNLLIFFQKHNVNVKMVEAIIVDSQFSMHTFISIVDNKNIVNFAEKSFYVPEDISLRTKEHFEAENGQCVIDGPRRSGMKVWLTSITGHEYASSLMIPLRLVDGYIGKVVLLTDEPAVYTPEHSQMLNMFRIPLILVLNNYLACHNSFPEIKLSFTHEAENAETVPDIIGANSGLRGIMEAVEAIAPFDTPVLICGETGTGKEMIANQIHYLSPRKDKPFVKINCGAIPRDLIESVLFGHEKGAFTGAVAQNYGCFETAADGSILLDEIGELPLDLQVKLLRVLQFNEFTRVGGSKTIITKARIIACTNQDLKLLASQNRFRADLYFRLNVFPLQLPSLRERREDLPRLIGHFISTKSAQLNLKLAPIVDEFSLQKALEYAWPGNVRELENSIERALIKCHSRKQEKLILEFGDYMELQQTGYLPEPRLAAVPECTAATRSLYDETMANCIIQALRQCNGRISGARGAAAVLGIHPNTLRSRMARLGLNGVSKTF